MRHLRHLARQSLIGWFKKTYWVDREKGNAKSPNCVTINVTDLPKNWKYAIGARHQHRIHFRSAEPPAPNPDK